MLKMPSPSLCMSMLAVVLALGGAGYSATGGNFILGQTNTASTQTALTAALNGRALQITNNSAAANATALGLSVAAGPPQITVNSSVKVANLNADRLDGLDSTAFARSSSEGWHYIGDLGEPPFENGWVNFDATTHAAALNPHASYRIDANGVVHVRGSVKSG